MLAGVQVEKCVSIEKCSMSVKTSEEALSSLDRSKNNPNQLLDQAATIIHATYNDHTRSYDHNTSSSTHGFREIWVLRWVLKKLSESLKADLDNNEPPATRPFALNVKTWSLLLHLFSRIPTRNLTDVLVERKLTSLLTQAGPRVLGQFQEANSTILLGQTNINHDEPPLKRRKLSDSPETTQREVGSTSTWSESALTKFLQVCNQWGDSISPEKQSNLHTGRITAVAWSGSVKEAAEFVSCALKGASAICLVAGYGAGIPIASALTLVWLRLWQSFSSSSNSVDKPTVCKIFNNTLLNPCLDLFHSLESNTNHSLVAAKKEIERQIALHTIMPLRSDFTTQYKESWIRTEGPVSWKDIKPFFELLRKQFGESLKPKKNTGIVVESLARTWYSTSLLTIASRLFPKDDMRRKYEQPFLEALSLCLAHLAYPGEMPQMEKDSLQILRPISSDLPPTSIQERWPHDLLQTLSKQHIDLSTNVFLYLASALFSWRVQPLPLSILRAVVKLRPDAFVTRSEEPNAIACFDTLLLKLSSMGGLQDHEIDAVLKDCIYPLMDAFASSQELDTFVEKWLPNIQEAFRDRGNDSKPSREISSIQIWYDEDLFQHLTEICQRRSMVNFTQRLMENVIDDLTTMGRRIGPTTDIFAKLAILENALKGNGGDVLAVGNSRDLFTKMADLLASALQQQNDYQGQKWRLWSVLGLFVRLDVALNQLDDLMRTIADTKASFQTIRRSSLEKLRPSQRNSLLAEQYSIFCLVINHCSYDLLTEHAQNDAVRSVLHTEFDDLAEMLSEISRSRHPVTGSADISHPDLLWDGRLVKLLDVQQLVEGCLGCILRNPWVVKSEDFVAPKLLAALGSLRSPVSIHSTKQKTETFDRLVEILITTLDAGKLHGSRNEIKGEAKVSQDDLLTLSIHQLSRGQRKQSADTVLKRLLMDEPIQDAEFSACLARLESLDNLSPTAISLPENFNTLADVCAKSIPRGPSAIVCLRAVTNIFDSMWLHLMCMEKKKKTLSHIWSWTHQCLTLTKQSILKLQIVLVMSVINKFSTHVKEVQKVAKADEIQELKTRFVDQATSLWNANNLRQSLDVSVSEPLFRTMSKMGFHAAVPSSNAFADRELKDLNTLPNELMQLGSKLSPGSRDIEKDWVYLQKHFANTLAPSGFVKQGHTEAMSFGTHAFSARLDESQKLHWLEDRRQPQGQVEEMLLAYINGAIVSDLPETSFKAAPEAAASLSRIATLQSDGPAQTLIGRVFHLEVSILLLKSYPGLVNQSTTDTLLQNLATWCSSSLKINSEDQSQDHLQIDDGAIAMFDRLVTILGVLLTKYRRRLTGRSHLLLPVLQTLLRCFFFTSSRAYIYQNTANWRQKQLFRTSLPSWLTRPLPPSSASKFSRILSSICNPTTASARSSHRNSRKSGSAMALNDETKKARRIAAQYMQYLVMEYARCSLDGVIQSEVKESLMPGLYSILDAIDMDLMRAMNAAMDPSSRAIFKGLYDDWVKYGKWDQS